MKVHALQCRACGSAFTQAGGRPAHRCTICRQQPDGPRVRANPPAPVEVTALIAGIVARQRAAIELAKACIRTGRYGEALEVLSKIPTIADVLRPDVEVWIPQPRNDPDSGVPSDP